MLRRRHKNDNSYRLHINRHIKDVAIAPNDSRFCYVRGNCIPEERQTADPYDIWVLLHPDGTVNYGERIYAAFVYPGVHQRKAGNKTPVFCICRKPYSRKDGNVIQCDYRKEWHHYSCIGLSNDQVDEIDIYQCSNCEMAGYDRG